MSFANPYKRLGALFVLIALFFQSFNKGLLIADYYTNTSAYVKNCENLLKPQLKCKGKCQMIKKVSAAEKEDTQNPGGCAENKYESQVSILAIHESMIFLPLTGIITNNIVPQSLGDVMDHFVAIFHPPQG